MNKNNSARTNDGFTPLDAYEIINALGGCPTLSECLGVSRSTVSSWLSRGIPKPWALILVYKFGDLMEFPEIDNPPNFSYLRREIKRAIKREAQKPNG